MFSLSSLDPLIVSQSLLLHPFYQRWSKGELTLEDLRVYAKEYFHFVQAVPGLVSHVLAHVSDPRLRAAIEKNVSEEREHIALWERFAQSLGVSQEELCTHQPSAMVLSAVRVLEELCRASLEEGVIALYALERELAQVAKTKKEGLLRFYGLSSSDAHAYFDEHLGEEKHLEVWRSVPLGTVDAKRTAAAAMTSQNRLLDAVCEECDIPLCS